MVHMADENSKVIRDNGEDYLIFPIGGGSLVDRRPVFSPDVEQLFVPQKNAVLSFSVKTGEFIRKFRGLKNSVIAAKIHPCREELLLAASESGEVIGWRWKTVTPVISFTLSIEETVRRFTDVHFLPVLNDNLNIYASWIAESGASQISAFSSKGIYIESYVTKSKEKKLFFDLGRYDSGHFLCAASRNRLYVHDITRGLSRRPIYGEFIPTCLTCHPTKPIVAVGDIRGRILIWSDVLSSEQVARSVHHWHTLKVRDVIFTREGSGFYSGGEEYVVVQWRFDSLDQSFLPRLPGSILHLAVSQHNDLIAVSTADNAIIITDSIRNIKCKIQNFSKGVLVDAQRQAPFPAGLHVDSRSRSLVLNGKTGYIQFFDPRNQRLLYNVDITGQNTLCQERTAVIENTEVTQIALSSDGAWMATAEFNSTGEVSFQVTLKFWRFDAAEKTYVLTMSIDLPHEGAINALKFRPTPAIVDTSDLVGLMAVSTGKDNKFRTWELVERQVIDKMKMSWMNSNVAHYRDLPAGDATFSSDGSILGVAFGPCFTLWDPEECVLKGSLTHPTERTHIRFARFGNEDCCHLLVTVSDVMMTVWNVLSLSISWAVEMKIRVLATDPCSSYMAAFRKRSVFVFKPNSPSPHIVKKTLCKANSSVVAAAFVPRGEVKSDSADKLNSRLYFLNSDQLLLSMVHSDETRTDDLESMPVWKEDAATPFSLYKAEQSKSDVKAVEVDHRQLGSAGKKELTELLQLAAHTMPPIHLLCGTFLQSLVIQSTLTSAKKDGGADESVDEEAKNSLGSEDGDSDVASEVEEAPVKPKRKSVEAAEPQEQAAAASPNVQRYLQAVATEQMKWAKSLFT